MRSENEPFDENDGMDEEFLTGRPRRRISARTVVFLAFILLLAGGVAGARFLRGAALVPAWAIAPAPTLAPTPSPTPAPTPSPTPSPTGTPAQSAAAFSPTAITVDGEAIGVLASREAAEALLGDVIAFYEGKILGSGELVSRFDADVEAVDAALFPLAAEATYDSLFALFTGEAPPCAVLTAMSETSVAIEPFETVTEETEYLLLGTRRIVSVGCEGEERTVTTTEYVCGEKQGESRTETTATAQRVDTVILIGTGEIEPDAEPGKSEGEKGPDAGELAFIRPIKGAAITSNFGQRKGLLHLGLDFEADEGAQVLASESGTVVSLMERGGYGLFLEIDHGGGFITRYAFLSAALVSIGDTVDKGDEIALAGQSGSAPEPMLHFELRIDGVAYNPRFYFE